MVVFLVAASGVRYLAMNPDARVFFSEDNPHLLALEQLENTYVKTENLLFILVPRDGEVFTRDTLDAVEWLRRKVGKRRIQLELTLLAIIKTYGLRGMT